MTISTRRVTLRRNFMTARWRWIAAVVLLVVLGAAFVSWSRTPTYRSSADVLVQPRLYAAGVAPQVPDMGTEMAVATSAAVLMIAAHRLDVPVSTLRNGASVSVPLNTHVLHISYTANDPVVAQSRAQAIAEAYVAYWRAQQPPLSGTPGQPAHILASSVLTDAPLPTAPASPNHETDIAIAIVIGLAVGVGTAYLRDRLDDRLRDGRDLERRAAGPVLTVVPRLRAVRWQPPPLITDSGSRQAGAYADLGVLLLHAAEKRLVRLVLVTTPSGLAHSAVSANLALALADSGRSVLLVHADLRRSGQARPDDDASAGLAAVIHGKIELADAIEQIGVDGLQELPAGVVRHNVAAALHGQPLRQALRQLPDFAEIVVIEGPAALAGPDVTTVAELADAVILVGDSQHTTRREVELAVQRLEAVGAKLIGSVLVTGAQRDYVTVERDFADEPTHRPRPGPGLTKGAGFESPAEADAMTGAAELAGIDDDTDHDLAAEGWTNAMATGKR